MFHENIKDPSTEIEDIALLADSQSRIFSVVQELDSREQKIVIMKFYEGLTNKEISEQLGVSETNVGTIVYRAVNKLRDRMLSRADIDV